MPISKDQQHKQSQYNAVLARIKSLIEGETDLISIMATVASELHNSFDYFDWTGFYRVVSPRLLKIGPYQGGHGCLSISFERGVCGAAARTGQTQLIPDVNQIEDHIACSASTQSEIVVPIINVNGDLIAVLDVDSNSLDAFCETDKTNLELLCKLIGLQTA